MARRSVQRVHAYVLQSQSDTMSLKENRTLWRPPTVNIASLRFGRSRDYTVIPHRKERRVQQKINATRFYHPMLCTTIPTRPIRGAMPWPCHMCNPPSHLISLAVCAATRSAYSVQLLLCAAAKSRNQCADAGDAALSGHIPANMLSLHSDRI